MSEEPENALDLGQELQFLPAWAQEDSKSNKYSEYEGAREGRPRGRGGPRRRDDSRGPRRDGRRPEGRDNRAKQPRDRKPRREDIGKGRGDRRPPGGSRDRPRPDRREKEPLLEIKVAIIPVGKGVESIAREIKQTGRSFPLFQIAQLILDRAERYSFDMVVKKGPEGKPLQRLFVCAIDQTLWLSEKAVASHSLKAHFDQFFEIRRTEIDPPKGNHTFVAQCGISGVLLGPPNHHAYQDQVARLHAERFARMPFDEFKASIRIVRDEETVQKWVERASWKTEFAARGEGEPKVFDSRADAEAHFRENFLKDVCEEVERFSIPGTTARALNEPRKLATLLRATWEQQRRFPLDTATQLSRQFGSQGLQFFKRDRTATHVSVARPSYLNLENTAVSDGIRRLVEFIDNTPECTRRKILEALVPEAKPSETGSDQTPEQAQLISDLHWLIHQGHVIEFSNGIIETAKRPREKTKDGDGGIQADCDSGSVEPAEEAVDQAGASDKTVTLPEESAAELKENEGTVTAHNEVTESEKPSEMSAEPEVVDKKPVSDVSEESVD